MQTTPAPIMLAVGLQVTLHLSDNKHVICDRRFERPSYTGGNIAGLEPPDVRVTSVRHGQKIQESHNVEE
jgi:hypothetical protein